MTVTRKLPLARLAFYQSEGAEDGGAVGGGDGAAGSGGVLADDLSGGTIGGVRTGKIGGTVGGVSDMAGVGACPAPAVRAPASGWAGGWRAVAGAGWRGVTVAGAGWGAAAASIC